MRIIIATDEGIAPSLEFIEDLADEIDNGLLMHMIDQFDDATKFDLSLRRDEAVKAVFAQHQQADGSIIVDFEVNAGDDWHIGEFEVLFDIAYKNGATSISIGHLAQNMSGIHFGSVGYEIIEIVSPKTTPFQGVVRSSLDENGLDKISILEGINDRNIENHPAANLLEGIVKRSNTTKLANMLAQTPAP